MTWVQQNYQGLIALAGALWTILSFINGKIQNPEAKNFFGKVLDALSYIARAGAEGSVKMPFAMSKAPGKLSVPNAPSAPVAALLPILFFVSLASIVACAHVKQALIDFAQCELGKVPSSVAGLVPDVERALGGSDTTWQTDLENLGKKAGVDAVNCAVASVVGQFASIHGELKAEVKVKVTRGNAWLVAHGHATEKK